MADNPVLDAAWFCALDLYRQQIQAVIAGFTNAPANEAELFSAATNGYEVHEIAILPVRDGLVAGESQALLRSLYPLANPVISPHYPVVAFLAGKGRLQVMPLAGTNSLDAADKDVVSATWSVDGRSLVYIVATEKQLVSEILSRTVLDAAGQLLTNAAPEDTLALAAVVPDTSPRLAALPDGRILFASMPLALPVRPTTVNLSARFFLVDPANTNSVPTPIEIKEGSLPDDLSAFSVSPDGRFVAVVESGTDAVALLELATGKVQIIAPAHKGAKSKLIPAWRNSRQLAYAGMPSPAATRPELILWQPDASPHVLSAGWPDDVVKPWLELPQKDAEQNQK